ncbi:hypothetical protein FDECE_3117 [Fusarium decemcellulare]|nr:hypothetical protein FDECE_3117 [Fusarium decemcellulare]
MTVFNYNLAIFRQSLSLLSLNWTKARLLSACWDAVHRGRRPGVTAVNGDLPIARTLVNARAQGEGESSWELGDVRNAAPSRLHAARSVSANGRYQSDLPADSALADALPGAASQAGWKNPQNPGFRCKSGHPSTSEFMSIENLKTYDPFAEADEDTGETKQTQNYIHIRIQQRNGRKTLTTVQGLPKKFDQKKILKVIKKKFACNGTIVNDSEMGEVIQLQGDQRKDVQEFLIDKKEGLELDAKTIKVHGF